MRIMHIITRFIRGGAQENTLWSLRGQSEKNQVALVTGVTSGAEGSLLADVEKLPLKIFIAPSLQRAIAPFVEWRAFFELRQIIREWQPEIVHTHSSKAGILGRIAAKSCGVPVIVHTIHGLAFHDYESRLKNAVYIAAEWGAAKFCDRLITVADAMTDQAVAAGVARREKFVTVYSGMEVTDFLNVDETAARARYGIKPNEIVIAKIARLFELKGHDFLFAAFAELQKKNPQTRLLLIGGGECRGQLEQLAQKLQIADRIIWTGLLHPEQVPTALAAADLVAHCSLREGLARVIPQALLMGKPVVAFDLDGAGEILRRINPKWLVIPKNIADLTEKLAGVINDLPTAKTLARVRGKDFCREQFAWQTMCARLEEIYHQCRDAKIAQK